jgi:hypothetical protein
MATVPGPEFDRAIEKFRNSMDAWQGEMQAFRDLLDLMFPPTPADDVDDTKE